MPLQVCHIKDIDIVRRIDRCKLVTNVTDGTRYTGPLYYFSH